MPSLNFFQFTVTEIKPGQSTMSIFRRTFMFKVTGSRSKVEPGSDYDVAQLDHGRNMCAKFELRQAYYVTEIWPGQSDRRPPISPPDRPGGMKTIPAQP